MKSKLTIPKNRKHEIKEDKDFINDLKKRMKSTNAAIAKEATEAYDYFIKFRFEYHKAYGIYEADALHNTPALLKSCNDMSNASRRDILSVAQESTRLIHDTLESGDSIIDSYEVKDSNDELNELLDYKAAEELKAYHKNNKKGKK